MSEGYNCFIIINLILFSITVKYLIHNVLALIRYDVIDLRMLMPVSSHEIICRRFLNIFPISLRAPVLVWGLWFLQFIISTLYASFCVYIGISRAVVLQNLCPIFTISRLSPFKKGFLFYFNDIQSTFY